MSIRQIPDQGRNNETCQAKGKKMFFQETLQLSPKFIIAIDYIYENNSCNTSKMVKI